MPTPIAPLRRILVIPARRRSTRLPDKMLLRAAGKSVIQHTYEAAQSVRRAQLVLIATDDPAYAATRRDLTNHLNKWMDATNDFLPPPAAAARSEKLYESGKPTAE